MGLRRSASCGSRPRGRTRRTARYRATRRCRNPRTWPGAEAGFVDAGLLTHVCEGTVAVVVIELRSAHGIRDEEVGTAVVVVIAPGAADGGPDGLKARLCGGFGECAITVVVKEPVWRLAVEQATEVVADEEIEIAVTVVIDP